MRYALRGCLTLTAVAVAARAGGAQVAVTAPAFMQVTCETVKPGMQAAHDQHEERWARAAEAAKSSAIAVSSTTGVPETCWLSGGASLDALAKANDALMADRGYAAQFPALLKADAEFISAVRTYTALLRTDLGAGTPPNVLSRRVLEWTEFRVRPGPGEALFANAVKAYRGAMERAGLKPEFRVYQVLHGMQGAVYWIFTSGTSPARFDEMIASEPKLNAAFTAEDNKAFEEYFSRAHTSVIANLYAYVPAQSALTAEQRASDPFWARKP